MIWSFKTFNKVIGTITVELIVFVVLCLNAFPLASGELRAYSSHTIVTWQKLDFCNHCRFEFGLYVKAHSDPTPLNKMTESMHGAICLGPTVNLQGSHKLLCLRTKQGISQKQIYELSMPGCVIQPVEHIAKQEQHGIQLVFNNCVRNKIDDKPDGLPLPDAITGVDGNSNGTGKTDACEDPVDGADKVCK